MKQIDYTKYTKPSDYVKFTDPQTTIRIVSSGALVKRHGMRTANRYIPLGNCTEMPDCKFCLENNEPKLKWTWIVYLKAAEQVKILDAGVMIGDQICMLAKSAGDPQEYDLIVKKSGIGRNSKYEISLGKKYPLTEDEIAFIKPSKNFLINKYFKSREE